MRAVAAIALVCCLAGCGSSPAPPGTQICAAPAAARRCPDGYVCMADNHCWPPGQSADGQAPTSVQDGAASDLRIGGMAGAGGDDSSAAGVDAAGRVSDASVGDAPVASDAPVTSPDTGNNQPPVDGSTPPTCPPGCPIGAKRCGSGGGVQVCVTSGGCSTWTAEVACLAGQSCQGAEPDASCKCATPPAGCERGQGIFCESTSVAVNCSKDGNGCVSQIQRTTCSPEKPCMGAFPTASCSCPTPPAECMGRIGRFCNAAGLLIECVADKATTCITLAQGVVCDGGKTCKGAFPDAMCVCSASNAGAACGVCGGTVNCDGKCSRPLAPSCSGKACGADDGCGGHCTAGSCPAGQTCGGGGTANVCGCTRACSGKCGGPDGCGGNCPNTCAMPQTCGGGGTPNVCGCTRACAGKCGGPDGCNGTCSNNCVMPQTCGGGGTANVCGCTPSCAGRCSGPDGCGGTCANTCIMPQTCGGGGAPDQCGCAFHCTRCGDPNPCGGICTIGSCPISQVCGGGGEPGVCACPSNALCVMM